MANQIKRSYDIVINGGGIVGFTLLNLILKSPSLSRCKVLLIERGSKPLTFNQPPRLDHAESSKPSTGESADGSNGKNFSNRVSSLTSASRSVLDRVGVWKDIASYSKDVSRIKVWNYNYLNRIEFRTDKLSARTEYGDKLDPVFSVVENNRIMMALLDNIDSSKHDSILWDHNVQQLTESPGGGTVDVTMTNSKTGENIEISTPFIVGSDGFASKVREFSRLNYTEKDLDKTAVVGTVRVSNNYVGHSESNDIAYQKFSAAKDSVAALLPLDNEYSSFVISAPTSYSKYLMDCDEESFVNEFNDLLSSSETPTNILLQGLHNVSNLAATGARGLIQNMTSAFNLGFGAEFITGNEFEEPPRLESCIVNSRASYPLVFGTTSPRMVAPLPGKKQAQIALVGDSSHRIHPLAGQGLNLGILDASELTKQLEAVVSYGHRVFDQEDHFSLDRALKNYQLKRQSYIIPMQLAILSMQKIFQLMPPSMVSGLDRCQPMKSASIKIANGCY